MKSGERTDKADGHIQDRARFLPGSKVSPPTHPKTNNLRPPFADANVRAVAYGKVTAEKSRMSRVRVRIIYWRTHTAGARG